jgi:hypothetical protein
MNLEGTPVPPKLFLAPAEVGGAPPGDGDGVDGAAASSASPPSRLASGRRMGRRQSKGRERAAYRTLNALSFLASPHLVADQCRAKANERSNSEVLHFQIAD